MEKHISKLNEQVIYEILDAIGDLSENWFIDEVLPRDYFPAIIPDFDDGCDEQAWIAKEVATWPIHCQTEFYTDTFNSLDQQGYCPELFEEMKSRIAFQIKGHYNAIEVLYALDIIDKEMVLQSQIDDRYC